ncbi:MAG: DUF1934 domain-containing protein [Clostridiales bacterium]|nr:DUF1934 domain-containing protein [Clostridiales bacterium]
MDKRIIINIVGEQTIGDEINRTEFVTEGRYSEENGKKRLEYDESKVLGLEGSVTSIEVDGDTVSLMRSGSTTTHMIMRKGEKCLNHYQTPFGAVEMGIFPLQVKCDMDQNHGELNLTYQLDVEGTYASLNQLKVSYTEPRN